MGYILVDVMSRWLGAILFGTDTPKKNLFLDHCLSCIATFKQTIPNA